MPNGLKPPARRRGEGGSGVGSVVGEVMRRTGWLILVALLIAGAAAQNRNQGPSTKTTRKNRRGSGKGRNRCNVAKCKRCVRGDKNVCEVCNNGYALTEENQCSACGQGCYTCHKAGPGSCDSCSKGFTLITSFMDKPQCEKCAPHCDQCDTAGPGKCNECKSRHMLTYTLPTEPDMPEIHECVPCGPACKSCSFEEGCTACDAFYALLPHGAGCAFSWARLLLLLGLILVPIVACVFMCVMDEMAENERVRQARAPPRRAARNASDPTELKGDRTEVVRKEDEVGARVHSRRGSGPRPLAHALREGSYHGSGRDSWREGSSSSGGAIPLAAAREDDLGYASSAAEGSFVSEPAGRPFGRAATSDDGLGGDEHVSAGLGGGLAGGVTGIDDLLQQEGSAVRRGASLAM